MIELFHGYTYSAHPLACAAGLATLDLDQAEGLFDRAKKLEPVLADAAMRLKDLPGTLDIRSVGMAVGIDLGAQSGDGAMRASKVMNRAFHDDGVMVRGAGNTLILAPPLIASEILDRRDHRQGGVRDPSHRVTQR